MKPLHEDEIPIDEQVVQRLLEGQHPEWSHLAIQRLSTSGSSNVLFRLGDDLLVRLPRQPNGGSTILKESRWLPTLQDRLPVRTPEIVAVGSPSEAFPEHWSIQRWIPGFQLSASRTRPRERLAEELGDAIKVLRDLPRPEKLDDSLLPYRGRSLAEHDAKFRRDLAACRQIRSLDLDLDAMLSIWEEGLKQPEAKETRWFHSDVVAENILVDARGHIAAILDFGGMGLGDPAIDLHGAWEIFDADDRARFRQRLAADDAEWLRGRAWALAVPAMTYSYYWPTMPARIRDRTVMAKAVLDGPD